jgi:hypothetical protein
VSYYRARKSLLECGFIESDREGRGAVYRPAKALITKLEDINKRPRSPDTYHSLKGIKVSPPYRHKRVIPNQRPETFGTDGGEDISEPDSWEEGEV